MVPLFPLGREELGARLMIVPAGPTALISVGSKRLLKLKVSLIPANPVPASDSQRCWAADWTADDAWLKPSLEIASAIPTSAIQRLRSLCFLPGLLANYEMTNGQTRRFLNLLWEKVFKD
jgi:hypothetical protein